MTEATTLIQRTRRFIGDWPEDDATTASISSSGTTLAVADSSLYAQGYLIQVESEALQVRALPSSTTLTVARARRGTSAAEHIAGTTVLIRPHFLDIEYLDALNAGIAATFPWLYQPVIDESITTSPSVYEYTVPTLNSAPIPYLSRLEFKENGDLAFRRFESWDIIRGTTPKIKLRRDLPSGTLRVRGFGPLPQLSALGESLSTLFPASAEDALVMYAGNYLLMSGEARRVREDTGVRDDRESANRTGSSMSAANSLLSRFQLRLRDSGMPPMPKHVVSVI